MTPHCNSRFGDGCGGKSLAPPRAVRLCDRNVGDIGGLPLLAGETEEEDSDSADLFAFYRLTDKLGRLQYFGPGCHSPVL